jgi:hypothetical protein
MLQEMRELYNGKSFAVLGSAPSLRLYSGNQDIAIGVNGAGKILTEQDIFLSMYKGTHFSSWFKELARGIRCILRPHSAMYSKRFFPSDDFRLKMIEKNERFMDSHPNQVRHEELESELVRYVSKEYEPRKDFLKDFPSPAEPHFVIREIDTSSPVTKDITKINPAGTSSCTAMQIAYLMGASEIHLYGIEFSNDVPDPNDFNGDNYFTTPKKGETGRTLPKHREDMDAMILEIISQGIPIISHGPTRLENSEKLSE